MKKLYTLAALAFAAMGANADVVLTYEGKTVDPSQTVVIRAIVDELDFGDGDVIYMITAGAEDPMLVNTSASSVSATLTAEVDGTGIVGQWCFPDNCFPFGNETKMVKTYTFKGNEEKHLALDASFPNDWNTGHGADYYTSGTAKLTISADGKTTIYNLKFVYDETAKWTHTDATTNQKTEIENPDATNVSTITANSKNAPIYDLTGRVVTNPVAGQLYIQGGKKVVK